MSRYNFVLSLYKEYKGNTARIYCGYFREYNDTPGNHEFLWKTITLIRLKEHIQNALVQRVPDRLLWCIGIDLN